MHYPLVPQRIPPVIPTLRLVVLLRDPVQRAISQYFHSCQLGLEPLAVEEVLAFKTDRLEDVQSVLRRGEDHFSHQQHSYVSRSCYDEQLPRWIDLFSPDQLLVLRSEDRLINAQPFWDCHLHFHFLQSDGYPLPAARTYAGDGEVKTISTEVYASLYQWLTLTYQWIEEYHGMSWTEFSKF